MYDHRHTASAVITCELCSCAGMLLPCTQQLHSSCWVAPIVGKGGRCKALPVALATLEGQSLGTELHVMHKQCLRQYWLC